MKESDEIKQGNSSIVKIYYDLGYVIKIPNKGVNQEKYIESQTRASDIMSAVSKRVKEMGVDIDIPSTLSMQNAEIKETLVPGDDFNIDTYKTLDNKTKDKLAKDLATFMITMHTMRSPQTVKGMNSEGLLKVELNRLFEKDKRLKGADVEKQIDKVMSVFTDKNVKHFIQRAIEYVQNNNDTSDNLLVMRHHDLRDSNIKYDKSKTRLGIIDFEGADVGHIYEDFVGSPPSLSWNFMKRVIKHYNYLSDKLGLGIMINPEKIKQLLIVKIALLAVKNNWSEKEITQRLATLGLLESEKVNSFKRGIIKLIEKANRYRKIDRREY